jgi:hypothetical protein
VRASGGIFYDQSHFNYNDVYINQTLLAVRRYSFNSNDPTSNPFFNAADPAGSATRLRAFLAQNFPDWPDFSQLGAGGQFVSGMASDFRIPYTVQMTGGVTHDIASRFYVQADYIHSRGKDAVLSRNVNVTQVNGAFVTIDPRFGGFTLFQNLGWIHYDALQTRAEVPGREGEGRRVVHFVEDLLEHAGHRRRRRRGDEPPRPVDRRGARQRGSPAQPGIRRLL